MIAYGLYITINTKFINVACLENFYDWCKLKMIRWGVKMHEQNTFQYTNRTTENYLKNLNQSIYKRFNLVPIYVSMSSWELLGNIYSCSYNLYYFYESTRKINIWRNNSFWVAWTYCLHHTRLKNILLVSQVFYNFGS